MIFAAPLLSSFVLHVTNRSTTWCKRLQQSMHHEQSAFDVLIDDIKLSIFDYLDTASLLICKDVFVTFFNTHSETIFRRQAIREGYTLQTPSHDSALTDRKRSSDKNSGSVTLKDVIQAQRTISPIFDSITTWEQFC